MDENRAAEFTGRVLADSAAAATIVLAALGDRTGLFKDLAEHGPATSGELASRTGLAERYVREWLGGMFASWYAAPLMVKLSGLTVLEGMATFCVLAPALVAVTLPE